MTPYISSCSLLMLPRHSTLPSPMLRHAAVAPVHPRNGHRSSIRVSAVATTVKYPFKHVCVVGGGVIGLTSAVRILQEVPDVKVTVVAEKFGRDTTTFGAAGIWGPYQLGDAQEELIRKWSKDTYDYLVSQSYGPAAAECGAYMLSGYYLYESPQSPPFWYDIVKNFMSVPPSQLQEFPNSCRAAHYFTSVVCEGRFFMASLTRKLEEMGALIVQGRVSSLDVLYPDFDLIVNCTGLQAKDLVKDDLVQPIRGQILKVHAPWVKHFYFNGPYYIVPNRDWVVLGGTTQAGDYNTNTSLDDRKQILQGCSNVLPSLEKAVVLDEWVGLRPGRKSVRLEAEVDTSQGKEMVVVHNYGHGGSGLTIGWGCAADVVGLVKKYLDRE